MHINYSHNHLVVISLFSSKKWYSVLKLSWTLLARKFAWLEFCFNVSASESKFTSFYREFSGEGRLDRLHVLESGRKWGYKKQGTLKLRRQGPENKEWRKVGKFISFREPCPMGYFVLSMLSKAFFAGTCFNAIQPLKHLVGTCATIWILILREYLILYRVCDTWPLLTTKCTMLGHWWTPNVTC
jgi:hypothetical protein